MLRRFLFASLLAVITSTVGAGLLNAQQEAGFAVAPPDEYRYQQAPIQRPTPIEVVQQRAMARADWRSARLEAMQWYGVDNLRPMVTPTVFAPQPWGWQFSAHSPRRPVGVISGTGVMFYR